MLRHAVAIDLEAPRLARVPFHGRVPVLLLDHLVEALECREVVPGRTGEQRTSSIQGMQGLGWS